MGLSEAHDQDGSPCQPFCARSAPGRTARSTRRGRRCRLGRKYRLTYSTVACMIHTMKEMTDRQDSPGARSSLLDRFMRAQPALQRRLAAELPEDLRAEMGAVTMPQLGAPHTPRCGTPRPPCGGVAWSRPCPASTTGSWQRWSS